MHEEIWKRLPIELYFVIKKLYLKNVEKSFRYLLAYKSAERQTNASCQNVVWGSRNPLNITYWQDFYDTFPIEEIMKKGLGIQKDEKS